MFMEELIVLFISIVFLYCFVSIRSIQNRLDKLEIRYADLKDRYYMWLLTKSENNQNKNDN